MKYYRIEPRLDNIKQLKQTIELCYSKYINSIVVTPDLIAATFEALCQKGYKMKVGACVGHTSFDEGINKFSHIVGDVFDADYFEVHTSLSNGMRMIKDLSDSCSIIKNAVDEAKEVCWVLNNINSSTIDDLVSNVSKYTKPDVMCVNTTNIEKNYAAVNEIKDRLHIKSKLVIQNLEDVDKYDVDCYSLETKSFLQIAKIKE